MKRKFLAFILIAVLIMSLTACGSKKSGSVSIGKTEQSKTESSTAESVNGTVRSSISIKSQNDDFSITRAIGKMNENKPMGPEGTWTIFVYLCGSNLESEYGAATADISEMLQIATDSRIKFVVETGGSKKWFTEDISSDKLQRYVITEGEGNRVDEVAKANMSDYRTLADFLSWGVINYPAEHMGVILWDHGTNGYAGVCNDERYGNDLLTFRELDAAFLSVQDQMTDKFEFIGFDACLMSTVEMANLLASYADYMYASQEVEPAFGWDYTAIARFLNENPGSDGKDLGINIVDSYYASYVGTPSSRQTTLSVIDLSKMDNVLKTFHAFSKDVYGIDMTDERFINVIRNMCDVEMFGSNSEETGYSEYSDLIGILSAGASYSNNAKNAINAVNDAVVYVKNGIDHKNACGLSVYFPYGEYLSSSFYSQIATTPYYLALWDRTMYGFNHSSDLTGYDDSSVFNGWGDFSYLEADNGELEEVVVVPETPDNSVSGAPVESPLLASGITAKLFDDGTFGIVVDKDTLKNVARIDASVAMIDERSDGNVYMYTMGTMKNIRYNWDKGEFASMFDGTWFALSNGQALCVLISAECDGYDIYLAPVLINDEAFYLKVIHDYKNGRLYIDGVIQEADEFGIVPRSNYELKAGDMISPLYGMYNLKTYDFQMIAADAFKYDGNPDLKFGPTDDAKFSYQYNVYDAYGNFVQSDVGLVTVENGNIVFDERIY